MQPFAFWPAIFIALALPVWMLDRLYGERAVSPRRKLLLRASLLGWAWGFGYLTAGLWWLGKAFLVEADQFAWAMPFGVVGLPAVLAFYMSLAFVFALLFWSRGWPRIFIFAFAITAAEWLRGHLMTGFPWNALGMTLGNHLYFMQAASLFGLYGMTLLTVVIGAAPATLTDRTTGGRGMAVLAILFLGALAIFGYVRIPAEPQPTAVDVRLRIVQPNVPQDENFTAANGEDILENYLALSRNKLPAEAPTHYIWPESAFPFLLHRNVEALDRIGAMLAPANAALITGAARMGPPLPGEEVGTFFNSIQVIDADGIIRDTYDKVHLVPFGEYEPAFAKALLRMTGLRQFVSIPGGFTPAENRKPFFVRGLPPIAASICYEAIFPGAVLPDSKGRQGVIVNVTNDAWFGDSPGPHQHFAQARLRSVEEGLPLVRAANSGISGVIDPYGRILHETALNEVAVVDSELPLPLDEATFFSRWPNAPFALMLFVCLGLGLTDRLKKDAIVI